jgi:malate dehydrogenase (oxaloacetate-decarboxylating)
MKTSAIHSIIIRVRMQNDSETLSQLLSTIGDLGGQVGAIDITKVDDEMITRDITINTSGEDHVHKITTALEASDAVELRHMSDRTFLLHLGGKIEVKSKIHITHRDQLSMAYTPGVARVCLAIEENPEKAHNLTIKHNSVAIVSDGTAVLGLGDIGPKAAIPVMEGKAMLMKEFADLDGFPICLDTKDIDEIVQTVKNIAPVFGAINLEDISAPRCFEIERRLKAMLDIPVYHDDQHGTAAVMTAAFINALKLVNKKASEVKVVFNGVGAAGTACKNMLLQLGVRHIVGCDRQGVLHAGREGLSASKSEYVETTNPDNETGTLYDAIAGADVFVGLSAPNILSVDDLKKMKPQAIVFAMANPTPEIMPEVAMPHVAIMATGRSDYPNQINNLLAFPGIFRGALDCLASDINSEMNLAAAYAIANIIDEKLLSPDYIVPSVFNQDVAKAVTKAVKKAARETGVARK